MRIRQMSGQVSGGSMGEYQADERAGLMISEGEIIIKGNSEWKETVVLANFS